ncbi:type II toxin-antitoxin system VapC family toxin [Variovorax sp. LjRoot175]|uniref:type II toxin-antitoxin system VapC family toxin n=1 Tax=Variovorax sp. LjRoot175 TaxID=3342276 RepID=UPI003ECC7E53
MPLRLGGRVNLIRVHYLDASALAKLVVNEPGSDEFRKYFESESVFYTTSICFAEVLGLLKYKYSGKGRALSEDQYLTACDELFSYVACDSIELEDVEISERTVFTEVETIARRHKLDVSDAFQIISVKKNYFSRFQNESRPILITADKQLADAARSEGLRVWYCIDEPFP